MKLNSPLKSLILLLLLLIASRSYAQKFNDQDQYMQFQATAYDKGQPVKGRYISVRLSIWDSALSVPKIIYSEDQNVFCDSQGVFNVKFNADSATIPKTNSVVFADIPWETGWKVLQIDYSPSIGGKKRTAAVFHFYPTPYAYVAQKAKSVENVDLSNPTNGQVLKYNGTKWTAGTDNSGSGGKTYSAGSGISIDNDTLNITSTLNYADYQGRNTTSFLAINSSTILNIDSTNTEFGVSIQRNGSNGINLEKGVYYIDAVIDAYNYGAKTITFRFYFGTKTSNNLACTPLVFNGSSVATAPAFVKGFITVNSSKTFYLLSTVDTDYKNAFGTVRKLIIQKIK